MVMKILLRRSLLLCWLREENHINNSNVIPPAARAHARWLPLLA